MLDDIELEAIDNWRFKTRMPSRAAAIRELLRRGLTGEGFKMANVGQSSSSFGIVNTPKADSR